MQRKILLLLTFILFFLNFYTLPKVSYAQEGRLDLGAFGRLDLNVMGVTCGIANSDKNRCCGPPIYGDINLKLSEMVSDPTVRIAFSVFDSTIIPPINILANYFLKFLSEVFYLPVKVGAGDKAACMSPAVPSEKNYSSPSCICTLPNQTALTTMTDLCNLISNKNERLSCLKCIKGENPNNKAGVWTAVGCVFGDIRTFIQETLLAMGLGLAGLIALLCIIYSAFQLQASQGNPEKIKKTQEMLTSCIAGLGLIIFSIFILRLIGVEILRIPGFGK